MQSDPKKYHKKMSYLKSYFRIAGYIFLLISLWFGVVLLLIAEAIGILEEKYE